MKKDLLSGSKQNIKKAGRIRESPITRGQKKNSQTTFQKHDHV